MARWATWPLPTPPWPGRWCAPWRDFDPGLIISSSTQPRHRGRGGQCGLRVATTFLADRAYDDEGLLVPRKLPDSVIHDRGRRAGSAFAACSRMAPSSPTAASCSPMQARSILLHGDTPGAVELARAVRERVEASGGRIVAASREQLA